LSDSVVSLRYGTLSSMEEAHRIQLMMRDVDGIVGKIKAEEKKREKKVEVGSEPTKSHHVAGAFCVGLVIGLIVSVFIIVPIWYGKGSSSPISELDVSQKKSKGTRTSKAGKREKPKAKTSRH